MDNIITDDPALLVRVIKERQALSRPELLGLRLRVLFDKPPREPTDPAAVAKFAKPDRKRTHLLGDTRVIPTAPSRLPATNRPGR